MENTKKANIEVTICEKTLYNYINSGLFLNINKSHIPYNKKDKLMKPKEKSIRKKGGRSIEERGIKYFMPIVIVRGKEEAMRITIN